MNPVDEPPSLSRIRDDALHRSTVFLKSLLGGESSERGAYERDLFGEPSHDLRTYARNLHTGLEIQLKKAVAFSKTLSLFRTPDNTNTDTNTIELLIRNQDRRFATLGSGLAISERQILCDKRNHIILGDPGSGKTTTLKRLVADAFEALLSGQTEQYRGEFPIVIRLGEIQRHDSLSSHICKELGLGFDVIEHKSEDVKIDERTKKMTTTLHVTREYKLGHLSLDIGLGHFLDALGATLFVDGLDEVHYELKQGVFDDLKRLSNVMQSAKMVLTSRYLADVGSFKRFNVCEILPLSVDQARSIAGMWLDDVDRFFTKLETCPYRDLSNRPLFLYLLLVLFRRNAENLPEQAVDVYRQIVLLVIREWDDDREYRPARYSKYKDFDTYKKEEMLSELAFQLTYKLNAKKVFSDKQLEIAYSRVYGRYPQLSAHDARGVVEDIEAHNGLIIKTGHDQFEFSHLSLQEYLCAKYLLSVPLSRTTYEYLNIAPAPLAVANVLSPDPSSWFATLFLQHVGEIQVSRQLMADKVFEFVDRLLTERVSFPEPRPELGFAVVYLLFRFGRAGDLMRTLRRLLAQRFVPESVAMALRYYRARIKSGVVDLQLDRSVETPLFLDVPDSGQIPRDVYDVVVVKGAR